VEILIAAAISLIIGGVIVAVLMSSQRSFSTGTVFMEVHSSARLAMDMMVRDVKWAKQISPDSLTVGMDTFTSGDHTLVLDVPSTDSDGDIIDDEYDKIVYHLTGAAPDQIERIVVPNAGASSQRPAEQRIIANNVSELDFKNSTGDWLSSVSVASLNDVSISVTTSKVVRGDQSVQETLSSIARLRNFE
jgi:hypothetical protein